MHTNGSEEAFPFPEWMRHAAEVEERCLSVAAAGLAAELGMIDRELLLKSREAAEARTPVTVAHPGE